jgi:protein-S-isoprenylcysteine O-methyltransferase Ste14
MKRILLLLLTIFFPWIAFLINDYPLRALLALVLQVTIIGWMPVSIWAWRSMPQSWIEKKKKIKDVVED